MAAARPCATAPAAVPRRSRRMAVLGLVLAVGGSLLVTSPTATAAPRPSIAEVKAQLQQLDRDAADAVEVLNGMRQNKAELDASVALRRARIAAAQRTVAQASSTVDQMARSAYTGGGVSAIMQALSATDPQQFLERVAAISEVNRVAGNGLLAAQDARLALAQQQVALDQDQAIMAEAVAAQGTQQARIRDSMAAAKRLIASLQQEERDRIAREAAAKRAAEKAAARAAEAAARAAAAGIPALPVGEMSGDYASRASIAVAYMLSQVGGIYSMDAHPPATWDCSKLTAYAWGRAGVSLAAYSFTQWNQTQRVSLDQLQPGDLLFYFAGGAHHVEMYIGGGRAVSASNPGVGVELQDDPFGGWYGEHFSGAGRVIIPA